jgi:hypothetical protein
MSPKIGIVVPTIGGRPEYLPLALESIRSAGDAFVLLVGRPGFDPKIYIEAGLVDMYLDEAAASLPEKINQGFRAMPSSVEYINWLGDDDLLVPGSLTAAAEALDQARDRVLIYGGCEYIGPAGEHLWWQNSGTWAVPLLRFGPQLIPQPGSLYSRDAFEKIGGLSPDYGWAFDFKLFLDLSKVGNTVFLNQTLAKFRWHPGSLSVGRRRESVAEASAVRQANLPFVLRRICFLWEWPVKQATYWAGMRLSKLVAK